MPGWKTLARSIRRFDHIQNACGRYTAVNWVRKQRKQSKLHCSTEQNNTAKFYLKFRLPMCPYDKKCLSHACSQTLEFPIKIQRTHFSICEDLQNGISFIRTSIMKRIPSTGLFIPNLPNILSVLKSLNRRQKIKGRNMFIYFTWDITFWWTYTKVMARVRQSQVFLCWKVLLQHASARV